jgi:hypothetical protein
VTTTAPPVSRVLTPTLRSSARRARFWIGVVVVVAIVVVISTVVNGVTRTAGPAFSATNASPTGSKALAEVLKQQGVDVRVASTLADAKKGLIGGDATLFLVDENEYLAKKQLADLSAAAGSTVILSPTATQLAALAPSIREGSPVGDRTLSYSASTGCDLPAAQRAGTVSGKGVSYRSSDTAASTCFSTGKSSFSVIATGDGRVTVVGAMNAFDNEHVGDRGNAALALGLLGQSRRLVWYLPTIGDSALDTAPTIGQLTPLWVSPVLILVLLTVLVGAVWRGRRMGPLVVENLPVVVRASETMEGRARLYQRSSARLRALDSLRMGAIARLATLSGLPRLATVDEVIAAVAAITGRDPGGIRSLLLDAEPATDRDLVRLSDALLELERAAGASVRPDPGTPERAPTMPPHDGE